ncbi:helix-turn-helix transcriptional regulator [Methanolobus halotolerans]|uniref:Transcriptional regulator n=1 Tax=Methanolobus halotolerans TaxID=2052935 RepID=A0A4E0PZN4_9EURY|nr:winged helix-turn-helix domain-containing protein [Methanolobus halotolerans]TGC09435.1 transcriptional regulator [Methanolobus halotolerans]
MKRALLDVIFASEKRKNVLLLLHGGPQEMEPLLKSLDTTRPSLLPQIRILEEHHLINHYDNTYELTTIGNLIVDEMFSLMSTIETLDTDIHYWGTHQLDFIPPHLLSKIGQLKDCKIRTPSFPDLYKLNDEILETSPSSSVHYKIATFFHPLFPDLFSKMIANNVNVYMILSQPVIDKLRTDHSALFDEVMKSELFNLFVYPEQLNLMAAVLNDYHVLMRPLKKNGEYDNTYVLCSSEECLEWGKEFFQYYIQNSIPVTHI